MIKPSLKPVIDRSSPGEAEGDQPYKHQLGYYQPSRTRGRCDDCGQHRARASEDGCHDKYKPRVLNAPATTRSTQRSG